MSETTEQTPVDVNDLLGEAFEPAVSTETIVEADANVSTDEDVFEVPAADEVVDHEIDELQVAAAAVREAQEVLDAAKAQYTAVAARHAARMQESAPLHVQNAAVREAQMREAEERQAAIANLAKLGFDPVAVNILAGGARIPPAPRKPHPPLFPAPKTE